MPTFGFICCESRPEHMKTTSLSPLQLETLEARDVPSARPLPVLMVLADQQDFYTNTTLNISSSTQQANSAGVGMLRSLDGGNTWTINQSINSAFHLAPLTGSTSDAAFSDYGQWRSRFGAGL
jgi:hypothetical protein